MFAIYLCSPHNLHNLIYIRDTLIGLYEGRFPSQPGFREHYSNTQSQCLKITEKVSFSIVSDYVYTLSGRKLIRQIERKSVKFHEFFSPFVTFLPQFLSRNCLDTRYRDNSVDTSIVVQSSLLISLSAGSPP